MELTDYNISFFHIKGKYNVLADAISRLKMLDVEKEPMEKPKIPAVSNMQEHVMKVCATDMHTLSTTIIHTEQMWDITCTKLESQLQHGNKGNFKPVILSASHILQKCQYIHGLKHYINIAPHSLIPAIFHELH